MARPNTRSVTTKMMLTAWVCISTARAHPPLAVAESTQGIVPLRVAPAVYSPGRGASVAGDWVPYQPVQTRSPSVLAFDCFEPDASTGVPVDGLYDLDCGMGSGRYFFGPNYVNPFIVNDMAVAPGFEGAAADRVEFAWYLSCEFGDPSERSLVAVFTAEDFDGMCVGPDVSGYYNGVVYDFGVLNCGGSYYHADINLSGTGLFHRLPADGTGGYAIVHASDVDGQGTLTLSTRAQCMMWGTKPQNPSRQGPVQWDDDNPADGSHTAPGECYSYDFGLCPDPLGAMACFYAPESIDDCNGNGVSDAIDLAAGTSRDENTNAVPDECEWVLAFDQLSWSNGDGTYSSRFSDWGRVGIAFDPSNLSLLVARPDGSYDGWLNLVVSVPGTPGLAWAVQNLPVYVADAAALGGRLPQGVWFSLNVDAGTAVPSLAYGVVVSPDPLPEMPSTGLVHGAPVGEGTIIYGGVVTDGPPPASGSSCGRPPPPAGPFVGAPPGTTRINGPGGIKVAQAQIAVLPEEINGCFPASIARSLIYLDSQFNSMNFTDTPVAMYERLRTLMGTSVGKTGTGTPVGDGTRGKAKYLDEHAAQAGGKVDTRLVGASRVNEVAQALNAGADVEIIVDWGKDAEEDQATSHIAFVSSVTPTLDSNQQITGFVVTTVEATIQGAGNPQNSVVTYSFDKQGNLLGPKSKPGARCLNFLVEKYQPRRPKPP